eukprot:1158016-Pelagomonas_calceolata.AAC.4
MEERINNAVPWPQGEVPWGQMQPFINLPGRIGSVLQGRVQPEITFPGTSQKPGQLSSPLAML